MTESKFSDIQRDKALQKSRMYRVQQLVKTVARTNYGYNLSLSNSNIQSSNIKFKTDITK